MMARSTVALSSEVVESEMCSSDRTRLFVRDSSLGEGEEDPGVREVGEAITG
jgi:hypothetical protein